MNALPRIFAVCCLLTAAAVYVAPAQAASSPYGDTHYAMLTIHNTTDMTLVYAFKWGESSEWERVTVKPGHYQWHSWAYGYPNENRSPEFFIAFDSDLRGSAMNLEYLSLPAFAVPYKSTKYAKDYYFRASGGEVSLYE